VSCPLIDPLDLEVSAIVCARVGMTFLVNGDPASGHCRQQATACEISRVRDGRIVSCRSYYMAETRGRRDRLDPPRD
jgi:hypothetical protein